MIFPSFFEQIVNKNIENLEILKELQGLLDSLENNFDLY